MCPDQLPRARLRPDHRESWSRCRACKFAPTMASSCPTSDANVARDGSVIRAWQRPLEEMLMLSLASSFKGWLLDISSPQLDLAAPTDSRVSYPSVFLDLNSRSQVRTILGAPRPEGSSHVGVIELAELQEIEVMSLCG